MEKILVTLTINKNEFHIAVITIHNKIRPGRLEPTKSGSETVIWTVLCLILFFCWCITFQNTGINLSFRLFMLLFGKHLHITCCSQKKKKNLKHYCYYLDNYKTVKSITITLVQTNIFFIVIHAWFYLWDWQLKNCFGPGIVRSFLEKSR